MCNYYFWDITFILSVNNKYIILLRYKFSDLNFIIPLTKYPHEPTYYFKNPHERFLIYITQVFSMLLGLHKYSIHKPINCLGPSHKYYPLKPTYYPAWALTKYSPYCYHIEPPNYTISIISPKALTLWENPKSPSKPSTKLVATWHPKARCYTAS